MTWIVSSFVMYLAELGGGLLDPSSQETSPEKRLIGSFIIYEAESLETVRRMVEEDIYYTDGVVRTLTYVLATADTFLSTRNQWDKEKLVIVPWLSPTPLPTLHLD